MLQKLLTILVIWLKEINLKQCCWVCLHQNLPWFPEMAAYQRPQRGQWPLVTFSSVPLHLCLKLQCSKGALSLPVHDGLIMGFRALLLLSKHLRDPCPSEEGTCYSLEASKADYAKQDRYQMKLGSWSRDPLKGMLPQTDQKREAPEHSPCTSECEWLYGLGKNTCPPPPPSC